MDFTTKQLDALWEAGSQRREDIAKRRRYYNGDHPIVGQKKIYLDGNVKSERVTNWIGYTVRRFRGAVTSAPWQLTAKDAIGAAKAEPGVEGKEAPRAATPLPLADYADITEAQYLHAQDSEILTNALVAGYGVEVHTFDSETEEIGITNYDPEEWVFVRDSDSQTVAAIWRVKLETGAIHEGEMLANELELMSVYTDTTIVKYEKRRRENEKEAVWALLDKPVAHHYGRVPVIEWRINSAGDPLVSDALMGMNDEYNEIDSASGDEIRQSTNALLAIWGLSSDWVKNNSAIIKELGTLPLPEGGNAEWLTKTTDTNRITERLKRTRSAIHMMGEVPDVGAIVGGTGATSGIALKLMFTPMREAAASMITYLKQGVRERVELINTIRKIRGEDEIEDFVVTIQFSMPVNEIEEWTSIGALTKIVSHRKQLELLSSVDDPERELEALAAERPELDEPADAQAAVIAQDERIATQAQALQPMMEDLMRSLSDAVTDHMLKSGAIASAVDRRKAEAAA